MNLITFLGNGADPFVFVQLLLRWYHNPFVAPFSDALPGQQLRCRSALWSAVTSALSRFADVVIYQ